MALKSVICMVVKPIWRGISRPFKFSSKEQTVIAEPQVAVEANAETNHDSSHPVEEARTSDQEVVDADDIMLESRKEVMKQVLLALKDPGVSRIGVYDEGASWMGGMGKTMLVKKVASRVKEEKLFDLVVFAIITQNPNIRRIQGEIANGLGFKFDDVETLTERADKLRHRLREKRKVLLILDDIWKDEIHLEQVGIPHRNEHKGLKILMTSTYGHVLSPVLPPLLSPEKGVEKNFKLGLLGVVEAWSLFEKTLGHGITDPSLQSIAHQVANRCNGEPILLVVVATALKGVDLYAWRDALDHLNNKTGYLSTLELSYNILLQGEEIKSLFLLCGLFEPNFISINDLFKYAWGMGLFRQSNGIEDARNRLHKLLDELKASTLLLEGDDNSTVRMHYVVRDFAVSIACRHHNIFTKYYVDTQFASWAFENVPKYCRALCFHLDNISMHPKTYNSLLDVLVLVSPTHSLKLPQNFFTELKVLKVLNLTNMHFSSLPPSLAYIQSVKILCLHFCNLEDISMIGELKNLQVLSLANSTIVQFPRQMAQLIGLQILDLTNCQVLEVIPSNILSCLTRLEELCLGNSFKQWEVKGKNADLEELNHLKNLRTLDIHIRDAAMLPQGLFPTFKIFIGDGWDWSGKEASKTLKLKLNSGIKQLEKSGIKALLKRAEDLHLCGQLGVRSILYELNDEGFPLLKNLHIQNNSVIQYIVKSVDMSPGLAFPRLKSLFLSNLGSLDMICDGQLSEDSFASLKILQVKCCGKVRNLFSISTAKIFMQLQEINVSYCETMEEFVAMTTKRDAEANKLENMDHLRMLKLCGLPKLRSFHPREANASSTSQTD